MRTWPRRLHWRTTWGTPLSVIPVRRRCLNSCGTTGAKHNLHGLRVVDVLEKRYPGFPGLNLSWELRESVAKHNASASTISEFNPEQNSLLEAQVVEKADSIAYDNHDLDDSLKAGLITEDDLGNVELWRYASESVEKKWNGLDKESKKAQTIIFLINLEVTVLVENTQRRL